jgi:hypothetical protein
LYICKKVFKVKVGISISWSIVISNCVIIHVLTLQRSLVHQITVWKCENWGHLPEMGFKSRRSNILILKICAFITVCFWEMPRIVLLMCKVVYLKTWQKYDGKGQISMWMTPCISSIQLALESSFQ